MSEDYIRLKRRRIGGMLDDRNAIEKIVEQELSIILLQAVKLAQKEDKSQTKRTLQTILRAIDARRNRRERATAVES